MSRDCWYECAEVALDEAGITATDEQIDTVAGVFQGCHENYGTYSGNEVFSANRSAELRRQEEELKQRARDAEEKANGLQYDLNAAKSNRDFMTRRMQYLEERVEELKKEVSS
jgi:chromosome segregation ATPase